MVYHTGPKIVTDGLVCCLDAADRNSYPLTGNTWYDLSGNGNHGSLQGDTSYVSSNNGGLYLDGTGDYITLGTKNFITNDFSLSMWIKPTHATKELYLFSFGYNSTGSALFWAAENTRVLRAGFYNGSSLNYGETTGTISNNIFYYVTWNREGSTNTLYINGQSDGTFSRSDSISSIIYDIGWATTRNKSTAYHQGDIYTTSIYNRSLSSDEIRRNYEATKGRFNLLYGDCYILPEITTTTTTTTAAPTTTTTTTTATPTTTTTAAPTTTTTTTTSSSTSSPTTQAP